MPKTLIARDEYGECRALNHSWKRVGLERHGPEVLLLLKCRSCSTDREDLIDLATGDVQRRYNYAKDYVNKFEKGEARPVKGEYRREWCRTILSEATGHIIRLPASEIVSVRRRKAARQSA
jgi:hypothetical protein